MPKIRKVTISIYHKEIRKDIDVDIMYNQDYRFYAVVPAEFKDIIHHLSDEKLNELSISKKYKHKYQLLVTASTERECISLMKNCLEYCVDKAIEQRNVIILFYNSNDVMNYNNHRYNKEHPQIGIQIGLTYAVETTVGDKKVYSTYSSYIGFGGEEVVGRHELMLYGKAATVIPDTPENRETLEQLYGAFKHLNEKLKEFTKTPENLLEFISSNVKLLN